MNEQPDLFAAESPAGPERAIDPRYLEEVRAYLHATLARVQAAACMPWADPLVAVREDNGFRAAVGLLPREEGARLWAAFDAEMERLYAHLNADAEADTSGLRTAQ